MYPSTHLTLLLAGCCVNELSKHLRHSLRIIPTFVRRLSSSFLRAPCKPTTISNNSLSLSLSLSQALLANRNQFFPFRSDLETLICSIRMSIQFNESWIKQNSWKRTQMNWNWKISTNSQHNRFIFCDFELDWWRFLPKLEHVRSFNNNKLVCFCIISLFKCANPGLFFGLFSPFQHVTV